MPTTARGIRITRTSSSKPIAFSPGTAQPRKPVSGLNQQANKSLHAGSDSELSLSFSRRNSSMNTQVVLITGGLTGIGRATALAFAKEGAQVVVSGRRDEEGKNLVAELRKLGAEAEFVRSDVRHEEDVRSLIDKTVARFGRLDAAVNCAGTEGTPGRVTEETAETYAATFDTNVLGTLLSMKHEMRVMLAQGSGSIVNVSSTYGRRGAAGASIYAASKHAVEGL